MAFFAPVQRRNPLHVPTHTPEPHRPATAPPWPSRSLLAPYLPDHPRPTVPPGRGAQSRPRLAPGLNGPVLTTPPALGIARPGAASRSVLVPFHMTGFDGFLRFGGCGGPRFKVLLGLEVVTIGPSGKPWGNFWGNFLFIRAICKQWRGFPGGI